MIKKLLVIFIILVLSCLGIWIFSCLTGYKPFANCRSGSGRAICPADKTVIDTTKIDQKRIVVKNGKTYYFSPDGCVLEIKGHGKHITGEAK